MYPCKEDLHSRFNIQDNVCQIDRNDIESQKHLFYEFNLVKNFWGETALNKKYDSVIYAFYI